MQLTGLTAHVTTTGPPAAPGPRRVALLLSAQLVVEAQDQVRAPAVSDALLEAYEAQVEEARRAACREALARAAQDRGRAGERSV